MNSMSYYLLHYLNSLKNRITYTIEFQQWSSFFLQSYILLFLLLMLGYYNLKKYSSRSTYIILEIAFLFMCEFDII